MNAHPTAIVLLFLFVTAYHLDRSRELMTFEPIKQSSHTSSDKRSESVRPSVLSEMHNSWEEGY